MKSKKRILMLNTENCEFSVPFNFEKVEGYEFPSKKIEEKRII